MSLNDTTADALAAAILSGLGASDEEPQATQWRTICRLIYSHLKSDAEVVVDSVSGVQSGSDSSGPGTGTLE